MRCCYELARANGARSRDRNETPEIATTLATCAPLASGLRTLAPSSYPYGAGASCAVGMICFVWLALDQDSVARALPLFS
jgi:hypothetical protein